VQCSEKGADTGTDTGAVKDTVQSSPAKRA